MFSEDWSYVSPSKVFDHIFCSYDNFDSSLKPNSFERRRALIEGMCTMLWQAGEKRRSTVVLMEEEACFGPDYRYRFDNLTERVGHFDLKVVDLDSSGL